MSVWEDNRFRVRLRVVKWRKWVFAFKTNPIYQIQKNAFIFCFLRHSIKILDYKTLFLHKMIIVSIIFSAENQRFMEGIIFDFAICRVHKGGHLGESFLGKLDFDGIILNWVFIWIWAFLFQPIPLFLIWTIRRKFYFIP